MVKRLLFLLLISSPSIWAQPKEYTLMVTAQQDSTDYVPYFSFNNLSSYTQPDSVVQEEGQITCYFRPQYTVPMTGRIVYSDAGEHFFVVFPPKGKSIAQVDVSSRSVTYTGEYSAVNPWMADRLYEDFWGDNRDSSLANPRAVLARAHEETLQDWQDHSTDVSEDLQEFIRTSIEVYYAHALVQAAKRGLVPLESQEKSQLFDSVSQLPYWRSPYLWSTPQGFALMNDLLLLDSEEQWATSMALLQFAVTYIDPAVAESFLGPKLSVTLYMNREVDNPELLELYRVFSKRYPDNPHIPVFQDMVQPLLNYAHAQEVPFAEATYHWQDSTATELAQLLEPYRGKVVLVDFWGTWCSPCLKDMRAVMRPEYRGIPEHPDLVKLYIAHEKAIPLEEVEKTIVAYQLAGEHYLKRLGSRPIWPDFTQLRGFPTYLIVDRDGTIIFDGVPNPSKEEALYKTLMEYLEGE